MYKVSNFISWLFDLCYGATKYPCAWFKPKIFYGTFPQTTTGRYQKIFYYELKRNGFKRTFWQLVFPGQVAGLIKKIKPLPNGANEYHVRFYDDGTIHCEVEVDRFSGLHWSGHREDIFNPLYDILLYSALPVQVKNQLKSLFDVKNYSNTCVRAKPIQNG